jgi:hypothetical protein
MVTASAVTRDSFRSIEVAPLPRAPIPLELDLDIALADGNKEGRLFHFCSDLLKTCAISSAQRNTQHQ